jgi:hypothetical protein
MIGPAQPKILLAWEAVKLAVWPHATVSEFFRFSFIFRQL